MTTLGFDVDGKGRPLVLLHGGGVDRRVWDGVVTDLVSAGFQVFRPDMPGHGKESPPAEDTVEAMVKPISDWLEEHVPKPYVLLGHSLGGMAAIVLASNARTAPKRLVLADTTVHASGGLGVALILGLTRLFAYIAGRHGIAVLSKKAHGLKDGPDEPVLAALRSSPWSPHRMLKAASRFDGRRLLPAIACPVLLLLAERNKATHDAATKLQDKIAEVHRIILPNTGHMMMRDDPQGFVEAVVSFLNNTNGPYD